MRAYKDLRFVERLFRTIKGVDLTTWPIHHRKAYRTTTDLFFCLLAYYVRWHLERLGAADVPRSRPPKPR